MTEPLTDEQLAAIQAREAAATPGPWYQQPDYGPEFIASEAGGYERGIGCLEFGAGSQARADREFVIAARADMPALLAEAHRLRDLVRDLADPGPCDHFDHHGYCQTHGWFATEPPCPHGRAQAAGLAHDDEEEESCALAIVQPLLEGLHAERDAARSQVAAARAFADEMAGYCSPYGIAAKWAQRLTDRLDTADPTTT